MPAPSSFLRWACGALAAAAMLLGAAPGPAAARVVGEIVGPGAASYAIAIPVLRDRAGTLGDAAARFANILSRDLALSGYFRILDREAYIDDPQTGGIEAGDIDFQSWITIGAQALVRGALDTTAAGIVIEARLFDVPGERELTAARYRGAPAELARAAHRFADEILRVFTGTLGPFDSEIAFVSGEGGSTKELFTVTFDAPAPRRLTADRSMVISPAWSPEARRITFTSYRRGRPALYEIDLGTGAARELRAMGSLSVGGAWSPDGSLLAVTVELDGNPEIVMLDRAGHLARRVTRHPAIDVSPTWSPDGRAMAFCSDRAGSPQIFVVGRGGGATRLTYGGSYNTSPAWSPRGDEIAYTGRVGEHFQIFLIDTRGGPSHQLTYGPGNNEDPSWSPDGRYLVFSSTRAGGRHLFITDRSGRVQKQLTHGRRSDSSPAWSPRRY